MKNLFYFIVFVISIVNLQVANAQGAALKEANELFDQFAYAKAIEYYQKVLDKDSDNKEAIEKIALCYKNTNNTQKAEIWLKKAIKIAKDKHVLKLYYAQTLMSNKKYSEAQKHFDEYTKLAPGDTRGWRFAESCREVDKLLRDSLMFDIKYLSINSRESDFAPVIFKDGFVFTSARVANKPFERKSEWTGEAYVDMYFTRFNNNKWSEPVKLDGRGETKYDEGPCTFSNDGKTIYFTRNELKKGTKKSILKIYESKLSNGKWSEPALMPFSNDNYSVAHPTLSKDGKKIYFSSDMPGAQGGQDIYVCDRIGNSWSHPHNLGADINSEGNELFPFIHEDGTLYFASDGLGGFGGLDIFYAKPKDKGWEVKNMGYPVNTSKDDFSLVLNNDKSQGFFATNRKGANSSDDIYELNIKEEKAAAFVATTSNSSKVVLNFEAPKVKAAEAAISSANAEYEIANEVIEHQYAMTEEEAELNKDVRIILIGIVLDAQTRLPIENAAVSVEETTSKQKRQFLSQKDGSFYVKLEPEKKYEIIKVGKDGKNEDKKFISTINKKTTDVIHIILLGTPTEFATVYKVDTSKSVAGPDKASAVKPKNDLSFKVQVGAFNTALQNSSQYLKYVKGEVKIEKSSTGLVRYVTGQFDNYNVAETYRKDLLNNGYRNAFVVGYLDGIRIEMPIEQVLATYGN